MDPGYDSSSGDDDALGQDADLLVAEDGELDVPGCDAVPLVSPTTT